MKQVLVLLLLFSGGYATARRYVPLMPPRATATEPIAATDDTATNAAPPQALGLGMELGLVGQRSGNPGGLLGMQTYLGSRFFTRVPLLLPGLFLKPSVGYFRRSEGTAVAQVTQHLFELGTSAQYTLVQGRRWRWLAGLAIRLDLLMSTLSVPGASASSPLSPIFRLGPMTGFSFGINSHWSLALDIELTASVNRPNRLYGGTCAGVVYYFR